MKHIRAYLLCTLWAGVGLMACTRFDPIGLPPGQDANLTPDAPITPDASIPDGPVPDVPPGDPCLDWTPVPAHFNPCTIIDPTGGLNLNILGTYTYDTDTGTLTDPNDQTVAHANQELAGNPAVWLVSVDSFSIASGAALRVQGTRPLVIASWSTLEVAGTIDVSSSVDPAKGPGAGANTGTCNDATVGGNQFNGGGGGGGGGFGGDGGNGGNGANGTGTPGAGGMQGTALTPVPGNVRGGCPGKSGGYSSGNGAGAGGDGGGALQLTAQTSITITGLLHAGGAGGGGADGDVGGNDNSASSGGGGGGSGGLIGLDAPGITIENTAILAANGGGGGGGCHNLQAGDGQDGKPDDTRAYRGNNEGGGGRGGYGGYLTTASTDGDPGNDGGGGGGGGVGYIIMSVAPTINGSPKISPPQTVP